VGWRVCKAGDRFAAFEPVAQGLGRRCSSVEAHAARGLALRMNHGSQMLAGYFLQASSRREVAAPARVTILSSDIHGN